MSISYPLTLPTLPGFMETTFQQNAIVGLNQSIFTGQQQLYVYSGQWWTAQIALPAMKRSTVNAWIAFVSALNGPQGTFMLGDSAQKLPSGTIAGTVTVGASAVLGSSTLPLSGGTGTFNPGDWLQVGTNLYCVTQVNSGNVDVFPYLRSAYASGTSVVYTNPKGLFRLASIPTFTADVSKIYSGVILSCLEVL